MMGGVSRSTLPLMTSAASAPSLGRMYSFMKWARQDTKRREASALCVVVLAGLPTDIPTFSRFPTRDPNKNRANVT